MASTPDPKLFGMLGLNVQGDLGGLTFYTSQRGKLVFFAKAPPLNPASPQQERNRNRFRACGYNWARLPRNLKDAWERATKRAGLGLNGYGLFTYWQMTANNATIRTVERRTALALITPPLSPL
jgi:hypothetical protein